MDMAVPVCAAFMGLDLITGAVKAIMKKNFSSTVMRKGLFHKSGAILCICLGYLVDYAQKIVDIGVSVPVAATICAYIVLMEIGSIIENLAKINPSIVPEKIRKILGVLIDAE